MRKFIIGALAAMFAVALFPQAAHAALPTIVSIKPDGTLVLHDAEYSYSQHAARIKVNRKLQITGDNLQASTGCTGLGTPANPIACWWPRNADGTQHLVAYLGPGDDRLQIDGANISSTVWIGGGNDIFLGGPGRDIVFANYEFGYDGVDKVNGGNGDDTLYGGSGNDKVEGKAGNDTLYGDDGNDVLNGGPGNDTITDSYGDDTIRGGAGNDTIFGSWGKDTVLGESGDDTVSGGPGLDIFDDAASTSPGDVFDFSYLQFLPGLKCQKQFYWWYYKTLEQDLVPAGAQYKSQWGLFEPPKCV